MKGLLGGYNSNAAFSQKLFERHARSGSFAKNTGSRFTVGRGAAAWLRQERNIAGKPLTVAYPWEWQPGETSPDLMIGSWKSATRFESVEFRPL